MVTEDFPNERTCIVLPSPMLWASMHPNPRLLENRARDSTKLS